MALSISTSRRGVVAGACCALILAACGRKAAAPAPDSKPTSDAPPRPASQQPGTLEWAVAGAWRDGDTRRDRWRHPLETLQFFGLKPGMTVVEVWPGAGWYTQILAPFLKETRGKLYAASFEAPVGDSAAAEVVASHHAMVRAKPQVYGDVGFTSFGRSNAAMAPAGSADVVLFMLTLHSWMAAGLAEKALHDAFVALKRGGVLGVEAHRAESGQPQDPLAANGYVQEAYVRRLAEEAGFKFDAASEINANPADSKDYPFGVATLPPERRSSVPGAAPDPAFDHTPYDTIGESDRMTLRFVKP